MTKRQPLPPAPPASSARVRARMRGQRTRDTKPEVLLRRELTRRGLRYRVHRKVGHWTADLVFPTQQIAVFVDGCFWHGCPRHARPARQNASWWTQKVQSNRSRDARVTRALRRAGWCVVRVWEHEPPARAAARIERLVKRRMPLSDLRLANSEGDR